MASIYGEDGIDERAWERAMARVPKRRPVVEAKPAPLQRCEMAGGRIVLTYLPGQPGTAILLVRDGSGHSAAPLDDAAMGDLERALSAARGTALVEP